MQFYELNVYSNYDNDNDIIQKILRKNNVDEYIKTLLTTWRIDWKIVFKLEKKHMKDESQQLITKRTNDVIDEDKQKINKQRKKNAYWIR